MSVTNKIFLSSALLVVAVLGVTFGVTSMQANRTADARNTLELALAVAERTNRGLVPKIRDRLRKLQ